MLRIYGTVIRSKRRRTWDNAQESGHHNDQWALSDDRKGAGITLDTSNPTPPLITLNLTLASKIESFFFCRLDIDKMTERSTRWMLTLHNPNQEEWDLYKQLLAERTITGQVETTKNGGIHLQFVLKTHQCRKRHVIDLFPRAHIEPVKNIYAANRYVSKPESRQTDNSSTSQLDSEDKLDAPTFWRLLVAEIQKTPETDNWLDIVDDPDYNMIQFDNAVSNLIKKDIRFVSKGTNPLIRKSWERYSASIIKKCGTVAFQEDIEGVIVDWPEDAEAEWADRNRILKEHNVRLSWEEYKSMAHLYETPGKEQSDSELHETESSERSGESSEESDEEDDGEGSESDSETSSQASSECSS